MTDFVMTLNRRPSQGGATIGELLEPNGTRICYTLEDEIREVDGEPVANWKIKGATAIPAGRYRITLEESPRFGPDTLTVNDVPGFAGVRMHAGNTSADTEGCPLLGMSITGNQITGGTSRGAVLAVKTIVAQEIGWGNAVYLDINNPTAVA